MREPKFILVVGTSAGGLKALTELVSQFRSEMDMAVFIVMHLSRTSIGDFLYYRLNKHTSFTCEIATENSAIQRGHIYICAPNFHLLVKKIVSNLVVGQKKTDGVLRLTSFFDPPL